MKVKILKDGRISLDLDTELQHVVIMAVKQRLYYDQVDLPDYLYFLLEETLQQMVHQVGGRFRFRRSEFLAVFHPTIMRYVDEPTQNLIHQAVQLAPTLSVREEMKLLKP